MSELFDLEKFNTYKEDNCREVKKAEGGLPIALWETYSSFANSNGGVIILGVGERRDGTWFTTGLKDQKKLIRNFWNTIHDTKKVSINLLTDTNVETYKVNGDTVIVIHVPRAKREQKPVYINNDLFGGTYRRNYEGDYHCSKAEIRAMLRDATEDTADMKVVDQFDISAINSETLNGYRNYHKSYRPEHVFHRLSNEEYLVKIGAAAYAENGTLHPTAAGLLMFGEEYRIVREFPEYFLDYREMLDPTIRWTDRLQSSSGDWTGNVLDFFFRANSKIAKDIKVPFKLDGIIRVDDTPVHKAVREALVNCLVNTDYFLPRGVVIKKEADKLVIANPGSIRTGKKVMLRGGISDPRNKVMMKMFNLIGFGERAGSGIPNIFQVWSDEGWVTPMVEETYNPDRTILTLELYKKQPIKTTDKKQPIKNNRQKQPTKTTDKKQSIKTDEHRRKIREYLRKNGTSKSKDIAVLVGLSLERTRVILSEMDDVEFIGQNKNREYRLIDKRK